MGIEINYARLRGKHEERAATVHQVHEHPISSEVALEALEACKDSINKSLTLKIISYWVKKMENNKVNGRPWYYGLPYTWWHGKSESEFLKELPSHVVLRDEPLWKIEV